MDPSWPAPTRPTSKSIKQITNGKSPMPGFKNQLKDYEIEALADYIKSAAEELSAGRQTRADVCAALAGVQSDGPATCRSGCSSKRTPKPSYLPIPFS